MWLNLSVIIIAFDLESALENEGYMESEGKEAASSLEQGIENESLRLKLEELESEISNICSQRMAQQMELDSIENMALKQRFQAIIDELKSQESMKRREYEELKSILKM